MDSNMEMSAGSILALFNTTKEQRATFAQSLINDIVDGNRDPLQVHLHIKCMEELIAQIKDNPTYKAEVLEAAQKAKGSSIANAKVEVAETGVKYDYQNCNDPIYGEIYGQFTKVDNWLKERQKFLKAVPAKGEQVCNEDSGEVYTIYPPVKTSTTTVKVTLK